MNSHTTLWPALVFYITPTGQSQLTPRVIESDDRRRGVALQAVYIEAGQAVAFAHVPSATSAALEGYRITLWDTERQKIRKGAHFTVPVHFLEQLTDSSATGGPGKPSLDYEFLGPTPHVKAAIIAFKTLSDDYVFQRFISEVETSLLPVP